MSQDILIENCNLFTAQGFSGVRSVLIRGSTIAALSEDRSQSAPAGALKIDAGGATVLPGLIDSHCHLLELGSLSRVLDLRGISNITSIRLRLFARTQKAARGEWIIGRGWSQEALSERRFPTRWDIDDLTRDNPTVLLRSCGHVGLLNTRGLTDLGIEESVADPPGGAYSRNAEGALDGLVKEAALDEVVSRLPQKSLGTIEDDILMGEYEAARNGITTVHCFLSQHFVGELEAFEALRRAGRLSLRHRLYAPAAALKYLGKSRILERLSDEIIRINGVKLFADGTLGARTASLIRPYSDDPTNRGILRYSNETMRRLMSEIDALGLQVATHAIGDRAIAQTLDVVSDAGLKMSDRRPRVEHASLAPPDLLKRMRELGVGVAVQPHFVASDTWAEERLGRERMADLYPFRSMLTNGLVVSGGSDAPTEPISPLMGFWAATTGRGTGGEQQPTIEDAIRMYTTNSALNGLDGEKTGLIKEGMMADLTVLDSNLSDTHPAMIRRVGIAITIVAGRIAYSYEGLTS